MSLRTGRYEAFADKYLHVTTRFGSEVMARCVFHEDSNASMQFNVDKGLYVCFSCPAKGGMKTLERKLGIRYGEQEVDVADIQARLDALKTPDADVLPVLPESWLSRYHFPTDYWAERGLTPTTVEAFDLGYDPLRNFGTIPIRNVGGDLLGAIKRYLDPDVELRYRYPKGFKRSQNLFASWLVEQDDDADTVVLTEGSLDAIKVWQAEWPAMAVYGSSMNPAQVRLLRRMGIGQVILMFDNDKAGQKATDSCLGWHQHLRGNKVKWEYDARTDLSREFLVRRVRYTKSLPDDPGAMTEDQIDTVLRNSKRV